VIFDAERGNAIQRLRFCFSQPQVAGSQRSVARSFSWFCRELRSQL
jgi:hypothetical protein